MEELHYIQMQALKELLYKPNSKFSDLNTSGLDNDHFSYHIWKLVELGLVNKENGNYSLSSEGKKYAGKMDTKDNSIEKQPKSGVLIIPIRNSGNKKEFLIQQRLKEPYYGYWGFMTGKIKFNELIFETATREFKEEMGLSADKFKLQYILHEMVYDKAGNQLEAKFFYVIEATKIKGELLQTQEGNNKWVSYEEFLKLSPKYHNEDDILKWYMQKNHEFKEEAYYIDKF